MKDFILIPLLIILYIICAGILGGLIPLTLYALIFVPFGIDSVYLDNGILSNTVLLLSWILPYFMLNKLHKLLKKKPTDNESE